jgi:hypothetical protein
MVAVKRGWTNLFWKVSLIYTIGVHFLMRIQLWLLKKDGLTFFGTWVHYIPLGFIFRGEFNGGC